MRTVIATALAFGLAVPAAVRTADACGGYRPTVTEAPRQHVAAGSIGIIRRGDDGRIVVVMNHASIDARAATVPGFAFELRDDAATRRLLRDWQRAERHRRWPQIAVQLTRTGEVGPWQIARRVDGATPA